MQSTNNAVRRDASPLEGSGDFRRGLLTPRNAPFALFVGGILAYGAAFAWYMLGRFDLVNLIRDANVDDSFYYFQTAWHLAEGRFSTFDGGITRTNGYHPLWLLLITPFYWVFDKTEALAAIKAFEIMLVAGGVALAAGAARVARLPWILLFAALPALYRIPAMFWGLEAAAAAFMLGLFLLAVCLFARDPARWRWPLAAVAFALPWVRLEYVAISLAATAALCLLERPWRDGPRRAPAAGVPFLAAGAGLLVYFAYNAAVFGGIVPVSGATKRLWAFRFWEQEGGYSLAENARGFLRTGHFDDELLVALEVCVYVAVVWWFSRRSRGRDDRLLLAFLVGVFGLAAGHLAKFAQSVLTVHPVIDTTHGWYFVPAYLMAALVVPARCYVAIWFVRRALGPELRRASGIPRLGIVAAGAVFLFATAGFTAPFRFVDWRHQAIEFDYELGNYMGVLVMDRVLPEGSVVGSWGSGVIGYFSRFPVMNLDGLVNSYDYLHAQEEGEPSEAAFRRRHGVTFLANLVPPGPDPSVFQGPRFNSGALIDAAHQRQFRLWPDDGIRTSWTGADRSAWFRERMGPHLERLADGVGLLVDGRLAQAFVPDCAPDDDLVVWTWGGDPGRTLLIPWVRMSTGVCTSGVVLPHDALSPVRAARMTVGEYLADRVGGRRPAMESDSGFDLYFVENRLVYVKERCGREDLESSFFLHLNSDRLPGSRRPYGFDNLDFQFNEFGTGPGARVGGTCLAEIPLPEYGVTAVRTGQVMVEEGSFRHAWEGEIRLRPDGTAVGEHLAVLADRIEERRPEIDSDFDVHLVENRLVYVKEQCGPEDVDAPFFLAVNAVDPDDLPEPRRPHGFDNLDFRFVDHGSRVGGACMVEVPLPEYGIATVSTGQVVVVEDGYRHLWEGEIRLGSE